VERFVRNQVGLTPPDQWDRPALQQALALQYLITDEAFLDASRTPDLEALALDAVRAGEEAFARKLETLRETAKQFGVQDADDQLLSQVMLSLLDEKWKDHLYDLDNLRAAIHYRSYGQRDPLVEYKKESFQMFQAMKERIDEEIVRYLWWLRPVLADDAPAPVARRPAPRRQAPLILNDPSADAPSALGSAPRAQAPQASPFGPTRQQQPARVGGDDAVPKTVRRDEPKVGRNDPCPCGSGKKYKKCHGAAA